MTRRIIKEKEDELQLNGPFYADEINDVLDRRKGGAPDFLKDLIDGPYDCDKLDYLIRDSYHLGTPEYGRIDVDRILDGLRVKNLEIVISSSALHAMMNSFRAIKSMYTAIYYHKTSRIFDFMIVDALMKIPNFIAEITSSIDEFIKYDDYLLMYTIKEKAMGSDSAAEPFKEADKIFQKVRDRKKTYEQIKEFIFHLPLVAEDPINTDIKEVCRSINVLCRENNAQDFNIRLDYRSAINPMGISLGKISKWLVSDMIYDTRNNTVKSLEEVYPAYYNELVRYSIIFRIYADKEKSKRHPETIKRIKEGATEELNNLKKKWDQTLH